VTAFPKYNRYKDSGVEWLGEVPAHWEVQSLRAVAGLYVEKNQPDLPVLSVYREYGVILKDSRDDNHNATSLDTSNYKVVRPGDLAVNKMKAWQGSLGVSEHHGIVSPAYITCRLNQEKVTGRYIHYLLRSKTLIGALDSISYGVRVGQWDMRFEDFKKVGITIPPKAEQDRIVAFLDRKTAEIDALIAKKQRQIELLDEQKAILINRAVTRGLNPNAKLKTSGIEWIGEIPEHWEVIPIKRHAEVQTGLTLGKVYPPFRSVDIPYLRVANVQNGYLSLDSVTTLRVPESMIPRYSLKDGDVLVAEGGDLDKLGRGCVWKSEIECCMHQNHVFAVRPNPARLIPEFLSLALSSAYGQRYFMLTGKQTTNLASTNSTALMNFPLALPSADEQRKIFDALKATQESIAKPRSRIIQQMQSLQTLRSTLIAQAVTGRIKVK